MSLESEVVKDVANPIRGYLELAAVILVLIAVGVFVWHERKVGAQEIEKADTRAELAAKQAADLETKLNQERAAAADATSDHDEKLLADYRVSHPEQPVRLCYSDNSKPALPKAGADHGSAPNGAGAGPAAVPEVPERSDRPGPDIRPELDTIVQAAAELAIATANFQKRDLPVKAP